ncbi:CRASP family complement regulator-acquiring lipoprotein [Borrelia persica]|uniref:CRASP family complement regulator-acquiring lipoprotein n=1 Tax=Borrelia persica TaxID=44448 RepID=UPI00046333AD|nr:CRASP family complement regulator-acquiring lipoprotein [Borrelia persica]
MKHKICIAFISIFTSLFLLTCNQDINRFAVSPIEDILSKLTPEIEQTIITHEDENWDENKQGYGSLLNHDQLFDRVTYKKDNKEIKYNTGDPDSKATRREIYLAFEYDINYITTFKAITKQFSSQLQHNNNHKYKIIIEDFLSKIRESADNYYLKIFKTLRDKKDNLKKLSSNDLQQLQAKFNDITNAYNKIKSIKVQIKEDYDNDRLISIWQQGIKSYYDHKNTFKYLQCPCKNIIPSLDIINNATTEITTILGKIQTQIST